MADEVNLHLIVDGPPDWVMEQWRTSPPEFLDTEGFELVDEAYNALTFRRQYLDWPQKLMIVMTLGFALLLISFMRSSFTLTARFDAEGASRTRVTVAGTAHPQARAKLADLAASEGGSVGLRVGV